MWMRKACWREKTIRELPDIEDLERAVNEDEDSEENDMLRTQQISIDI